MDIELTTIQITQDMEELAEQYEVAASNERLWAKGSPDAETAQMHEENAEHAICDGRDVSQNGKVSCCTSETV